MLPVLIVKAERMAVLVLSLLGSSIITSASRVNWVRPNRFCASVMVAW